MADVSLVWPQQQPLPPYVLAVGASSENGLAIRLVVGPGNNNTHTFAIEGGKKTRSRWTREFCRTSECANVSGSFGRP